MKKARITLIVIAALVTCASAQTKNTVDNITRPKLVIGIVVDQMRWDYLYRFYPRYSAGGFKRLLNNGFSCENTFIPFTPTYTAPGHACIYTGSVPAIHGIISNYWYDKKLKRSVYFADDTTVNTLGSTSAAGKMSPANMWTTTITDELRLATNFRSKVIGIALKDRGAILPAGHSANAAYWFDNANGGFITSSYYLKELPQWVKQFNDRKLPDAYLRKNWATLYPVNSYTESTEDSEVYENTRPHLRNSFPHVTAGITTDKYNALRFTPAGNTLTVDMAKAAIDGEHLGQSAATDFLAVSFSSNDYIGHHFGPNSIEIEDTYLALDKDLELFFAYLDTKIGKGQYLIFLTADHAAAHVPAFLKQHNIPAGNADDKDVQKGLNDTLSRKFNIDNAVENISNYQVYLKSDIKDELRNQVKREVINQLLNIDAIAMAMDLSNIAGSPVPEPMKQMLINGYNQKLSGDVQFVYKPHWFEGTDKGTTHGAWNPYDSHIPLLWYGWGIRNGKSNKEHYMTDIAATVAALLHIQMPSGCIGKVIDEVIK